MAEVLLLLAVIDAPVGPEGPVADLVADLHYLRAHPVLVESGDHVIDIIMESRDPFRV